MGRCRVHRNNFRALEDKRYLLHQVLYLALYILCLIQSLQQPCMVLLLPFLRWENWSLERIKNLLQASQLLSTVNRVWAQCSWWFCSTYLSEASRAMQNPTVASTTTTIKETLTQNQRRFFWLRIHQFKMEKVLFLTSESHIFCFLNCNLLFV